MGRVHVTLNTRYKRGAEEFIVSELLPNRKLRVKHLATGEITIIHRDELIWDWACFLVQFEILGPNTVKVLDSSLATRYTFADFENLPEKYQKYCKEAWRRYKILKPLLELPPEKLNHK